MSRAIRKQGISLKDKLETYHLSFDLEELKKSLDQNMESHPEASVYSSGKRAWFKGDMPTSLVQMDRQIRRRFGIGEDNKVIAVLYYPPFQDDKDKPLQKSLVIKENKPNVMSRFLISTTHEVCDVTMGSASPESLEFRPWVAVKTPEMIGGMLSYTFSNDRNLVIPPKKGFRQIRKTKQLDSRYIIVFDYLVSKNQLDEINKMFSPEQKSKMMDDPRVAEALRDLQS